MSSSLVWDSTHDEVSLGKIREVEEELGIIFPSDYLECVKVNNGGYPSREVLDFEGKKEAIFYRLLSFHREKNYYILSVYNNVKDRMVDGVIPFANDPFGNLLCFDYRQNSLNPTVVFWDHEIANDNPERAIKK
jgi:hypothetical protein